MMRAGWRYLAVRGAAALIVAVFLILVAVVLIPFLIGLGSAL